MAIEPSRTPWRSHERGPGVWVVVCNDLKDPRHRTVLTDSKRKVREFKSRTSADSAALRENRESNFNFNFNRKPTLADIEAERSDNGGFSRESLIKFGVAWPPPKGWIEEITGSRKKPNPI